MYLGQTEQKKKKCQSELDYNSSLTKEIKQLTTTVLE